MSEPNRQLVRQLNEFHSQNRIHEVIEERFAPRAPQLLGSAGLPSALRELCSRTNESISCRCDCPRSLRVEQNVAVNLYRIAQEAITNSVKHAKANQIVISLERTNGEIMLTVSDDGEGKRRRARGLGTHIMEYRARAIGGTLEVESNPRRGTTITCRVPIKR